MSARIFGQVNSGLIDCVWCESMFFPRFGEKFCTSKCAFEKAEMDADIAWCELFGLDAIDERYRDRAEKRMRILERSGESQLRLAAFTPMRIKQRHSWEGGNWLDTCKDCGALRHRKPRKTDFYENQYTGKTPWAPPCARFMTEAEADEVVADLEGYCGIVAKPNERLALLGVWMEEGGVAC